ncbi:MAG: peptide ABC transporter substrate-binding protein [Eubacterium sp.]|nr:peptide ABC transporter substrate-binding protein [Eubacterium sp.]
MNKIIKIISVLLCLLLITSLFSGCKNGDKSIDFIYPFDGDITSFDPQVASTEDEFLIAENCYEGLVRVLDDGEIKPASAQSWEISADGLVYTFHIKEGLKWDISNELNSEGEYKDSRVELVGADFDPDVTANDFVFALRRAVAPETNAPLFSSVSGIVNANEIHSGNEDRRNLGVKAVDDYTLEITLTSPDESFLSALSTAVAMPCNEEFFNATKGRYGLSAEYSLFNGQFYVSAVLEASYILNQNKKYTGDNPTDISNITLSIKNEETDVAKHLKSGLYDCAYISGSEYEKLSGEDITVVPYSNTTWALMLNKNRQLFSNDKLREAVCLSITEDEPEHEYLKRATSLTPPSCIIGGQSAVDAMGSTVPTADPELAQELWREGLKETEFTTADITVICTEDMNDAAKALVQGIQATIGSVTSYGEDNKISFSLKIEAMPENDFYNAVAKSEYDIALYPFTAASHNTVSFLSEIIGGNYIGETQYAEEALAKAQSAGADNLIQECINTEEAIIDEYTVFPVLFESSYYAQAEGVSSVQFHPGSGRVCFVYATRED